QTAPVPAAGPGLKKPSGQHHLQTAEMKYCGSQTRPPPPYSLGFQVSLTAFLMVELVLGFSSNLTVLVLYCSQSNLVDSVSNMVTVSLHVLDVAVCVLCLPLTLMIVLLPQGTNLATLCCFHEACVTFTSIATAINILVISLDRYDISVRPANRLLTTRRAALLLAAVWVISVAVFFIPFFEMQWMIEEDKDLVLSLSYPDTSNMDVPAWQNRTSLCGGGQDYHTGLAMYHLVLQVPIFFTTVAVMLFTYSRILRALNIRIGSHMKNQRVSSTTPLVASAKAAATPVAPTMGVQASVSAIIALRRAVRRHRDRRERQRRVFKMSLIIITTFLGCWAPLSVNNLLILSMGPSQALVNLRLWFLALAYGTTVSHPLLYAFTRQKLRRALRSKVKKRVVSLLQVDPSPGGTVIHNSWVENRKTSRDAEDI
uniref:G-protein coupled receptor 22 n=1 Tax=Periophthalmus magnuspinnatus TaxID=409849 RepID=A0A3B4AP89_9GOBI